MQLGHHSKDRHTWQSIFSWIVFVKNKTKRIRRKLDKPVSPNVGPYRILGATSFFNFFPLLHSSQYLLFFILHDGKIERISTFEKIPRFCGVKPT